MESSFYKKRTSKQTIHMKNVNVGEFVDFSIALSQDKIKDQHIYIYISHLLSQLLYICEILILNRIINRKTKR